MARDTANAVGFMNPDSFTSGLIDQIDATITKAEVVEYDFGGKAEFGNACAAHFTLTDDNGNELEDGPSMYYPLGQIDQWVPSDDGSEPVPVGPRTGFNKKSAFAQFIKWAVKTGIPKTALQTNKVTTFEGYKFHWEQKAKEGQEDKGNDAKTMLVPTRLLSAPGDKPGKKPASKPATSSAAASSGGGSGSAASSDVTAKAKELTVQVLNDAGKALNRDEVSTAVFQLVVKDRSVDKATRKAIIDLFADNDFIQTAAGPKTWMFDEDNETIESA